MARGVLVTTASVALLGALVVGPAWALQRRLIYFPSAAAPAVASVLPGAREVTLHTDDGLALRAWWLPAGATPAPAVLVANGNAGDRSLRAPLATAVASRGISVLLFDYRGFGGNPGSPTEDGLSLDAAAARRFLAERDGVRRDRIVYFGESLGAAVVTRLAVEQPPAGLVLRSPFVDLAAVGQAHYPFLPVRALLKDRYPLRDTLRGVRVPVTVVYGSADSIVPPEQSRAVADAAPTLRRLVEVRGADHNDLVLLDGPQVVDAIVEVATGEPGG